MKAKELIDIVGTKIAENYNNLGFKYTKKWGVKRQNDSYRYSIHLSSFSGNTNNNIALAVAFTIDFIPLNEQLIHFNLWNLGNTYRIGESHTIDQAFVDIKKHIDCLMIPYIDIFENQILANKEEWIQRGFTSWIPASYKHTLFNYQLAYTTHKHYWIGTTFLNNYNQFGFTISLPYIKEMFGSEDAERCLINYYKSINTESQKNFLEACRMESNREPWGFERNVYPSVSKVRYTTRNNLLNKLINIT